MTKEEAIAMLKRMQDPEAWEPQITQAAFEALNMAISALEADRLSSTEPQRMRAKWIATTSLQKGQITWRDYKCSNCSHHRSKPMNFCEVCGRKMER